MSDPHTERRAAVAVGITTVNLYEMRGATSMSNEQPRLSETYDCEAVAEWIWDRIDQYDMSAYFTTDTADVVTVTKLRSDDDICDYWQYRLGQTATLVDSPYDIVNELAGKGVKLIEVAEVPLMRMNPTIHQRNKKKEEQPQ